MKRTTYVSLAVTLLVLFVWASLIVATSQDFVHEGPHGPWFVPIKLWIALLQSWGWSHWLSILGDTPALFVGVFVVYGPFLLSAFVLSHFVVKWSAALLVQPNSPADALGMSTLDTGISQLFDDIISRDPTRIWASSCAIVTLRDESELGFLASKLDEIRSRTEGVELGGALFSNEEHLKFALRKLQYFRDKTDCLCKLYPEYLMFSPEKEQAAGNVRIEETVRIDGKWVDYYKCTCTNCRAAFKVDEREYHYTWWGWQLLVPPSIPADAFGAAKQ